MTANRSWMILALLVLGGWLVWRLSPVITPFAVAAAIAYLTDPLVDRLEVAKIGSRPLGRTLAVSIVFLLLTLSLIHISEPTRHICLSRMPSSA